MARWGNVIDTISVGDSSSCRTGYAVRMVNMQGLSAHNSPDVQGTRLHVVTKIK